MCGKTWFCEEPVRVCGTLGAPPAAGGDGKKAPGGKETSHSQGFPCDERSR